MLIDAMIRESCEKQLSVMNPRQLDAVKTELAELVSWCDRWAIEVRDPPYENRVIPFFVTGDDGKPVESLRHVRYWPGEEDNQGIWGATDDRIFKVFLRGKSIGCKRPSSFFAVAFSKYIYSRDMGSKYDGKSLEWAAALYMSHRMWSTTRVTYRYEREAFSTRIEYLNEEIVFHYGKDQWWKEMIRRGLVKQRK